MSQHLELNTEKLIHTIALSSGEQIAPVTDILKNYLGITHYCYIRSFRDGSHILLSNDSRWIESFYLNFYQHGAFHKVPESYHSGHVLWSSAKDQTTFNVCREQFNIDHGITIIEKQKESCEFYCFGTTRNNIQIVDFYLSNLDLLKRFNTFFKEQTALLIKQANSDRIILPHCQIPDYDDKPTHPSLNETRKDFMNATSCKKYYLNGPYSDVHLSARELDCLNLITFGKPNKEVGNILGLSVRTVENYLNTIKVKLKVWSKSELILKSLKYNQYKPHDENGFLSNLEKNQSVDSINSAEDE